jgi:hypothetical protein
VFPIASISIDPAAAAHRPTADLIGQEILRADTRGDGNWSTIPGRPPPRRPMGLMTERGRTARIAYTKGDCRQSPVSLANDLI